MTKATFAAGCFWGVEAAFRQVEGVAATRVGYTGGGGGDGGGTADTPTYQDVCTGRTGHAEAVEVEYDPARVSYEDLLAVFWASHDPTTRHRQGPDVGTQYRSAIFFHTPEQEAAATASKRGLDESGRHASPVVTEIAPAATFHEAEEYHQQYLEKRGRGELRSRVIVPVRSGAGPVIGRSLPMKVNLREKLASFDACWVPKVIGELNGQLVKVVKADGEYVWHHHDDEDELFLVLAGRLDIHLRERIVELKPGEFFIVPRGVEHKPVAVGPAEVLLFEPAATRNTGNVDETRTIEPGDLDWI